MTEKTSRVVGYVRVSTEAQAESGLSLEAQTAKLRAYAVAMDLDLVDIVVDAGVSGKNINRPGLNRVLAMLESGAADGVIVSKIDRLTRSVRDLGGLVDRYFATRFSLLSVADAIDTRTAGGRLVLNVLGSVSQWEREAIGERTSDAPQAKKARRESTGAAPYGFRVSADGKLEEEPAERAVLAEVAKLRAMRMSIRNVVPQLSRNGVVSGGGRPLTVASVHSMVKSAAA